jgi:hypothetical protein
MYFLRFFPVASWTYGVELTERFRSGVGESSRRLLATFSPKSLKSLRTTQRAHANSLAI